jgi:hypothetical protein
MGNAYNSASLLVTPNGYKASKIYSAKPTDGTGDLAFSRASTAMRRNSAGLWESVANNVPRLQYPVGGGCPSWLFEPQATNLILSSEALSATYIVTDGTSTITANAALSPRGTTTAASFMEAATSSGHYLYQFAAVAIGLKYTISARIKPNGRNFAGISFPAVNGAFVAGRVWFNLTGLGSVGTKEASIDSASIAVDSEGYYFIQATATATATASAIPSLFIADADNSFSYSGDITKGLYVWNFQFEEGSVASSPIITAGSAVTRLVDVASKTSATALIGQTEGNIFFDVTIGGSLNDSTGKVICAISDGTSDNIIVIYRYNNLIYYDNIVGGAVQFSNSVFTITSFNTRLKGCVNYKLNSVKSFINGALTNTDTNALIPACSRFDEGNERGFFSYNGLIGEIILYKTALSDSEAIELTTL